MNNNEFLHCDNFNCGYDLPYEGDLREELIGTPCPKCGESLLTKEDYELAKDTMELFPTIEDFIDNLSEEDKDVLYKKGLELYPELKELPEDMIVDTSIHIHNNTVNIDIKKVELSKISTAKEILSIISPSYKTALTLGRENQVEVIGERAEAAMIRFAKLHVEEALKAVHSNMQLPKEDLEFILNAYPLTNIK